MDPQALGYLSTLQMDYESEFGVDPVSPAGFLVPFNSYDLSASRNQSAPATMTGTRNPVDPILGNITADGNLVVPVDVRNIGWWLLAMLNEPATTGASSPYSHVWKVNNLAQPSFLLEKKISVATPFYYRANGLKINSMGINVGGDSELTASLGLMGADEVKKTSAYDASPTAMLSFLRFQQAQAALKLGGSTFSTATQFNMNMAANLDGNVYPIGSAAKRGGVNPGLWNISGTLTDMMVNADVLDLAEASTETSLEITFTNGAHSLAFKFPEVKFAKKTPGIPGPGALAVDLNWMAYYDDNADASAMVITLVNDVDAYVLP